MKLQWRIQDFPEEGAPTMGESTFCFDQFSPKTAWKWKKIGPRGCTPLDPPVSCILPWNKGHRSVFKFIYIARESREMAEIEAQTHKK